MMNLKTYLEQSGIRQSALAAQIGVSRGYVSELVGGTKTPSLEVAAAIERLTNGAITAISWVTPSNNNAAPDPAPLSEAS